MILIIQSGFLIVKTFEKAYMDYLKHHKRKVPARYLKSIPKNKIHYRGLYRNALDEYNSYNSRAELLIAGFAMNDKCLDGFITTYDDAVEVYDLVERKKNYEIVWVKRTNTQEVIPGNFSFAGFDTASFTGDHFSSLCEWIVMPNWLSKPPDDFAKPHFKKLNQYGLFSTLTDAENFLNCYFEYEWAENANCEIAEIYICHE